MFSTILNNKGITLIESMIAVFLAAVAVISLLPMQDTAWRTATRADYIGRAAGILQAELERNEYQIMRVTIPAVPVVVTGATPVTQTITVSGLPSVKGDLDFTVETRIQVNPIIPNTWIVNVRVTWPGNNNGITSSIIAGRLQYY